MTKWSRLFPCPPPTNLHRLPGLMRGSMALVGGGHRVHGPLWSVSVSPASHHIVDYSTRLWGTCRRCGSRSSRLRLRSEQWRNRKPSSSREFTNGCARLAVPLNRALDGTRSHARGGSDFRSQLLADAVTHLCVPGQMSADSGPDPFRREKLPEGICPRASLQSPADQSLRFVH